MTNSTERGGQSRQKSSVDDGWCGTSGAVKTAAGATHRAARGQGRGGWGEGEGAQVGQWGGDGGGHSPACLGEGGLWCFREGGTCHLHSASPDWSRLRIVPDA